MSVLSSPDWRLLTATLSGKQVELLMDVVAHAISVLTGSLLERIREDGFRLLRKSNWDKLDGVGDESAYVLRIKQVTTATVTTTSGGVG